MPSSSPLSPEQIEAWLEELDAELARVQCQIEPLVAEQARLHERQMLLKGLLASFDDDSGRIEAVVARVAGETTRERVHRQAVEVFRQLGRALHTNDLHAEFVRRGFEIPGAGKPNNITVHLSGWSDIASPERGVYGLVEHVGEQPPKPRSTRKKRRAR